MPPLVPKSILQQYFETGDKPTAAQFGSLINSMVNILDDRYLLGLRIYDPSKQYLKDDTMVFGDALYICLSATTGPFDPTAWQVVASFGSVVYSGTWKAKLTENDPPLSSGVGTKGYYYVVTDADADPANNVNLDGINDWKIGDWAIFNGTVWQIVRNSELPIKALDVIFDPTPEIGSDNVQFAIEEVYAAKQSLLKLKPTFYPYASDTSVLSDGVISNEKDGIALQKGKIFRSDTPDRAQINFGATGTSIIATTDGGKGSESILDLEPGQVTLQNRALGYLSIILGPDKNGEIDLYNNLRNGLLIAGDALKLEHFSGASMKITKGQAEIRADIIPLTSSNILLPNLTANTALYLDGSNRVSSSPVTSTELGYLSGVTSSIQSQIDSKQNNLGFTPVPDTRTINTYALTSDITLTKSDVNLGNVPDVDATNPANITQNPSYRFVTDTEKAIWNGKQDALGFTPVPDTRTVNGHQLNADVTVTKTDLDLNNVTNDRQLSLKASFSDEVTVSTSISSTFATAYSKVFSVIDDGASYILDWYYELGSSTTGGDVGSRVSFDSNETSLSKIKPGVANTPGAVEAYVATRGFIRLDSVASGSHTFLVELNRPTSGGTAYLRRPRFTLTKI